MPFGLTTPGDFGPLQAPPALRRNPRQALAPDPLLRELAQCYLPVQRARAQDRLLPYPPGFVPPGLSGIQEAASWPARIRHLRFTPRRRPGSRFRRPERPRLSQARRKLDRFFGGASVDRDFPALSTRASLEKRRDFHLFPRSIHPRDRGAWRRGMPLCARSGHSKGCPK
jgi:hypothetical protein